MTPFRISEGEWVLRAMLREAGVDPDAPKSAAEVWEVFRRFAEVPSEASGPDSDGVLYESGAFSFYGPDEFYLDFVRQFDVAEPNGEHHHYEQLVCRFRFALDDRTERFERFSYWWFAGGPRSEWDDFVAMVESRPEFTELGSAPPSAAAIEQAPV